MKITIDHTRPKNIVNVSNAKYLKDSVLRIIFNDGNERVVDFKPFLKKEHHPVFKKFLKESNFKKFKIQGGNINWNDYEMIFPIEQLYNGKIE